MSARRRIAIGPVALIGGTAALPVIAFLFAAGWIGPRRISGGDVTAALEYNTGMKQPGYRRAHAKGMCFSGSFTANGAGRVISKAGALANGTYPVIGRFSIAGGNPLATDGRNVFHSMALVLTTPDGEEWRMAMDHTPIFPVADAAGFVALQRATKPDPRTGKPDPAAMQALVRQYPSVKAFQDYLKSAVLPSSFANATYYSINAFTVTDGTGHTRVIRWHFAPEAALTGLDKAHLDQLPREALFREMIARTAKEPSRWHLILTLANAGDETDNATVAWTGPHKTIDAGVLTVDQVQPEEAGPCRDLNFDPTILPRGIGLSDDPLLAARSKTYSSSFTRRAGEGPHASAVGGDLGAMSEASKETAR